jgi:hypothetical protein
MSTKVFCHEREDVVDDGDDRGAGWVRACGRAAAAGVLFAGVLGFLAMVLIAFDGGRVDTFCVGHITPICR